MSNTEEPKWEFEPSGGNVGFLIWAVIFSVSAAAIVAQFARRRHIQPIKARQSGLTLIVAFILVVWTIVLCIQRVFSDDWSCITQLWSAFVGILTLCNVYMVRCWLLYANFNLATEAVEAGAMHLEGRKEKRHLRGAGGAAAAGGPDAGPAEGDEGSPALDPQDPEAGGPPAIRLAELEGQAEGVEEDPRAGGAAAGGGPAARGGADDSGSVRAWFLRHKQYLKSSFILAWCGGLSLILLIPPFLVTFFTDLHKWKGDGCQLRWKGAATALSIYIAAYLIGFIVFAVRLRGVFDNFGIKAELRATSLLGFCIIFVWYPFNNVSSLSDINEDVPITTLALLLGATIAFVLAVVVPLRASFKPISEPIKEKPADIDTFEKLVRHPEGFIAFREFLTTEFSVENLLFWQTVEEFREHCSGLLQDEPLQDEIDDALDEASALFDLYCRTGAILEVNLKSETHQQLSRRIGELLKPHFIDGLGQESPRDKLEQAACLFDDAQSEIGDLMAADSYHRFLRSDMYLDLVGRYGRLERQGTVLRQVGVL